MSEAKDPAIKLFGKTIPLPPNKKASSFIAARTEYPGSFVADDQQIQQKKCFMNQNMVSSIACSTLEKRFCNRVGDGEEDNKKPSDDELTKTRLEDGTSPQISEELKDPAPSTPNPETQSLEKGSISLNTESDELSETNDQQEKTLKKPDKILPCPRCNSMDTKFCYYNNYNVNQPRYFCRNCQRYWTEGGTMRNVPVGSGRRKSKSSFCSHYRHILVSDADMANVFHHTNIGTKAPIVGFGLNSSVCESTGVERYLVEKSGNCKVGERGLASNLVESGGNPTTPQEPCFGGPPWPPYPWNSPQWGYTMPLPTTSTLGPPHFPATFYPPPAYWRQWNFAPCPNSLTLGKHSREGKMLKPLNSEEQGSSKYGSSDTCVWMPKTLRFDDPSEAARSKIWSALGIKHENTEPFKGRGLFRTLKLKNNEKTTHRAETSLVLQANPAALSRSRNFHESV